MNKKLYDEFIKIYGESDESIRVFKSPGRVNLIGEHIDYNGGYVFPAALSMATTVLARKRTDNIIRLYATDLKYVVQAELDRLEYYKDYKWGNYQLGVANQLIAEGYSIPGCEMLFEDKVPLGSGLSSSAAIEVATALALNRLGGYDTSMKELAVICQKAEHNYVGVNCGIMDQFASAMGKADHAILLYCRDLSYSYIPLDTKDYKLVISNTKKRRSLGESAYNQRREECETALKKLKTVFPEAEYLCDISSEGLNRNIGLFDNPVIRNRAIHVINENTRVIKSAEALKNGELEKFGKLMIESHNSLRDLYEVSCFELDTLVEVALEQVGVLGSRMTGAGFGGCTVSLVHRSKVDSFIKNVGLIYNKKTGLKAEFYISDIGDGGMEVV
ncbi:MAG: galactokinase [Clostridiales bacterium]|nr:galactokinase [Clostridiales bacterium]